MFDQRILLGEPMQILEETDEIEDGQNTENTHSDDVQRAIMDRFAEVLKRAMVGSEGRDVHQQDIGNNDHHAELRRTHISVRQFEFRFEVGIDADIDRKGKIRTDINKIIVFFLTGFWHGANFTFILWGLMHGGCLLLENHGIIPSKSKKLRPLLHIYTLLVVVVTFVIFRADSVSQGFGVIAAMFGAHTPDAAATATVLSMLNGLVIVSFVFGVILSTPIVPFIRERIKGRSFYPAAEYAGYTATLFIFALCVLSLVSSSYNPFIYFRF